MEKLLKLLLFQQLYHRVVYKLKEKTLNPASLFLFTSVRLLYILTVWQYYYKHLLRCYKIIQVVLIITININCLNYTKFRLRMVETDV